MQISFIECCKLMPDLSFPFPKCFIAPIILSSQRGRHERKDMRYRTGLHRTANRSRLHMINSYTSGKCYFTLPREQQSHLVENSRLYFHSPDEIILPKNEKISLPISLFLFPIIKIGLCHFWQSPIGYLSGQDRIEIRFHT